MGRGHDEALLGFDARLLKREGFRAEMPDTFLLRTDLDDVFSVDTMVWPSVFDGIGLEAPPWIGMNSPFWESLVALRSAIPAGFEREHPYRIVAATWHAEVSFEDELRRPGKILGPHLASTVPAKLDETWRFLGFDVADPGISGLSNCGYGDEREGMAAEWGPRLNRYHLFDDLEQAFAFCAVTEKRVPEHAPFAVIGLWTV